MSNNFKINIYACYGLYWLNPVNSYNKIYFVITASVVIDVNYNFT
jgi:hypothetical protein